MKKGKGYIVLSFILGISVDIYFTRGLNIGSIITMSFIGAGIVTAINKR